jgi:hypothetical protein
MQVYPCLPLHITGGDINMSIIKEIYPQCDICKCAFPDMKCHSVLNLRGLMRKCGFKSAKDSMGNKMGNKADICPDCINRRNIKKRRRQNKF